MSAAPKFDGNRQNTSGLGVKYAYDRWAVYDSLCCHAVLANRFTAEILCLAYRSSIDAAIYNMLQDDGRFQRDCGWLANEAIQLGMIAIWRHAPKSLDRPATPEYLDPDGFDDRAGPDRCGIGVLSQYRGASAAKGARGRKETTQARTNDRDHLSPGTARLASRR